MKRKNTKYYSLKRRTVLMMIIFFLFPLLLHIFVTTYNIQMQLKTKVLKIVEQNYENMTLYVRDIMQPYYDMTVQLSDDSYIYEQMMKSNFFSGNADNKLFYLNIKNELSGVSSLGRYSVPFEYAFLNYYGDMVTGYTYSPYAEYEEVYDNVSDTEWFSMLKDSYASKTIVFTGPSILGTQSGDKIYFASNIVKDQNVGIVLVSISKSFVSKAVADNRVVTDANTFLFDEKAHLIVEGNENTVSFDSFQKDYQLVDSTDEWMKIQGNDTFVIQNDFVIKGYDADLKMVTSIPKSEIYQELYTVIWLDIIIIMLYAVCICYIFFLLSKTVLNPILRLSTLMKHVTAGELDVRADELPNNEIGRLGDGFNGMLDKINENIREIKKNEKEKRQVEIRLLQNQIRPHFVKNILNVIIWLANLQGAKSISCSLLALSNLLEYNFKDTNLIVTVEDELNYVKEYLYLQKIRFQYKFEDVYEVDESILHYKVLKLCFQPVVENCIYHGLLSKESIGTIVIQGEIRDNKLVFTISDDGVGMDEEKLENLLTPTKDKHNDSDHIALWNVSQRIQQRFGEEYGLTVDSKIGSGTTVTFYLPILSDD
jgi:two-component system sensor histidine kinase YesM